jgi:hypothetical protein
MAGRIGYEDSKGIIHSVYIHWDSFPEHIGSILLNNYNSYDKAKALVEPGNISLIPKPIDMSSDPVPTYYKSKGQDWVKIKPNRDYSIPMWLRMNQDKVYFYLYTGNRWMLILHSYHIFSKKEGGGIMERRRIDLEWYLSQQEKVL